jgi:XTP/dITP diphosphohydrolase
MKQLLVATNNAHKLQELQFELKKLDVKLSTPAQVGVSPEFDVEETGTTFAENAELKARAFAKETDLLSVADDSGLVVHALGGQPGVHSKRWIEGSDHDRNVHLLKQLESKSDRSAEFVTVLALYEPSTDQVIFFEGSVQGSIIDQERGAAGFGYDPVFAPEGYQETFAELGIEIKATLSHRHRAIEKLAKYLAEQR